MIDAGRAALADESRGTTAVSVAARRRRPAERCPGPARRAVITNVEESMTEAKTAIAEATAEAVTVRGHDLTSELMGHLSLTEMFFLLLMGRAPDERERRMTDACLVAIAEHGLVPSVQAARMTLSSAPESLQGAVAAGLLGCGSVILGATEYAGTMLRDASRRAPTRSSIVRSIASSASRCRASAIRCTRTATRAPPGCCPLRRARRVRRARRARARDRGRRARGLRPRAAAQRVGRDRRADARPRPARLHAQGDPAARAHRGPARPPARGARAPDRLPPRGGRRGRVEYDG